MVVCNSYNNGHCNYYGVEVRELNYKCERGECMTKEELIQKLKQCNELRKDDGHEKADYLLLEYIGDKDIVKAFEDVDKWYS